MIGDILKHAPKAEGEALTEETFKTAGRIMTYRTAGKAVFANLEDESGAIQIYVRKDAIGDEAFEVLKKTSIGDIVGLEGTVFVLVRERLL